MKRKASVVSVAIIGAVAMLPIGSAQAQPEGRPFRNHTYERVELSLAWHDAAAYCTSDGGYLVTIQTAAENRFVHALEPTTWLGATDEGHEGTWEWLSDEPFGYRNWATGEPNNMDGIEHYLTYEPGTSKWNDVPADEHLSQGTPIQAFVCEYPS